MLADVEKIMLKASCSFEIAEDLIKLRLRWVPEIL